MRTVITGAIAAAAGAFVLGVAATGAASAADLPQSYQPPYQQPAPDYHGAAPVEPGYAYPPPVAYGYPPRAYYAPPVAVVPRPYPYFVARPWLYRPRPVPYGPAIAHGYGRFGHWGGYRHW
jgi:hypothetical protein